MSDRTPVAMKMFRMEREDLGAVEPLPVPAGYTVRPYERGDWETCLALMIAAPDPAYVHGPWDRRLCERSMRFSADEHRDYPGGRGQVVFHEGEMVAMALSSDIGYLNQVYTLPGHRRKGLAAAAVTRVLAALDAQGVERCFLLVFQENLAAIRCYARLGFASIGPQFVPPPEV